ncbi:hypothetical protein ASG97_21395 [Bacillus sp. Soil745]|nr:hypothetical protein ASG97_21395 [Bacillus sp. Soil745]
MSKENYYLTKEIVNNALITFYKFTSDVADNKGVKIKEIIKKYYDEQGTEYDDYYDFETLDRMLQINAIYLCVSQLISHKEVYLKYLDDSINLSSLNDIFNNFSIDCTDKEKLIIIRNCFCHNDFKINTDLEIIINYNSQFGKVNINFSLPDFYQLIKELDSKKYYISIPPVYDKYKNDSYNLENQDDAYEYIKFLAKSCAEENNYETGRYINHLVNFEDNSFKIFLNDFWSRIFLDENKNAQLITFMNKLAENIQNDINNYSTMFGELFDLIDTVRFYLNYDRQSLLEYDYDLLNRNYLDFYFKTHEVNPYATHTYLEMYVPKFQKEWELIKELDWKFNLYSNATEESKTKVFDSIKLAMNYFIIHTYSPMLQDFIMYFPFDKLVIDNTYPCESEDDIKRHLRNSVQHHNYQIKGDLITFSDYNVRSFRKTFSASIELGAFIEAVNSAYFYIPYESPFN